MSRETEYYEGSSKLNHLRLLPKINPRMNLSEFANSKIENDKRIERMNLKSKINLRYGSLRFMNSQSPSTPLLTQRLLSGGRAEGLSTFAPENYVSN